MLPAIVVLLLSLASSANTVEVVSSSCSEGENDTCLTLASCLSNITACFASDTTVNFIERFYIISQEVSSNDFHVVSDIRNLTIAGNSSRILCTGRIGFAFINITNLNIQGLQFELCGKILPARVQAELHLTRSTDSSYYLSDGTRVALLFGNILNLTLLHIGIHNSHGYGVIITNSLWIMISSSNISHSNSQALDCHQETPTEILCCNGASSSNDVEYGSCSGGNIVIINTDQVNYALNAHTISVLNTSITHGINLDTKRNFNENYTYTAGGLSLYTGHSLYSEDVIVKNCTISSNVGHVSGNAVVYIRDSIKSNYRITITQTSFHNGNSGFQRFEKTAQSGGLTIKYGYLDEYRRVSILDPIARKRVIIEHSTFRRNRGFTAGAILFQSHIFRDKRMLAGILVKDCILSENFGYDTILTVRGNQGNRFYDINLNMVNTTLLNNKLLNQPLLTDQLIVFHHLPLISTLHIEGIDTVTCTEIRIEGNELRGISAAQVIEVRFRGVNVISSNRGTMGGAINIYRTRIRLQDPGAKIYITNNSATLSGGAIYVFPSARTNSKVPFCFFDVQYGQCDELSPEVHRSIVLRNNTAGASGHSVYGGDIEVCSLLECFSPLQNKQTGLSVFKQVFDIPWNNSLTEVTSDVKRLCFCVNGQPECDLEAWIISTYPGGLVHVPAVAVGQLNGSNPSIVFSRVTNSNNARIADQEKRQQVGVRCQNLNYTIHSLESAQFEIELGLTSGETYFRSGQSIVLNTTTCPLGFQLGNSLTCSCVPILEKSKVSCSLEMQSFERPAMVWIGYNSETNQFLAHNNCPLQKCKSERSIFTFNETDIQCEKGFSGILCGKCTTNLSATFGSVACKKCVLSNLALVMVIFVIAGPLLIFSILYGDLTINKGTLASGIFYANVVHIHRSILFGPSHISAVTVIIAWLNLDLGIELCFYPGMTFYARLWFQYLFPTYLMLLVLISLCLNWYTSLGGRIIGNNIHNVTSTILLLAYTKLLRTVAETLSFTTISSSLGNSTKVWLYDANIPYMEAKHVVIAVVAVVVLACFILPFTVFMVFEYPLLRHKTRKLVLRLVPHPLIHGFQKPYKKHYRWWTGLLLLIRVLLVTLHQTNILGNQRLNLIVIVTIGLCILGTTWNLGSMYKCKYAAAIEAFYLTNLVLLAGWSEYVSTQQGQQILSYVLVTLALLVLAAILLYHIATKVITVIKEIKKKKPEGEGTRTVHMQHLEDSDSHNVQVPSSTYIQVTGDQRPLTELIISEQ